MTTVNVLLSISELTDLFGINFNSVEVQRYTAHKLNPYFHLHRFSYYDFIGTASPIDGRTNKQLIKEKIKCLKHRKRIEIIKLIKHFLCCCLSCSKDEDYSLHLIFDLLSGKLTDKSYFYNVSSDSSYIDRKTAKQVYLYPEQFLLLEINLHV